MSRYILDAWENAKQRFPGKALAFLEIGGQMIFPRLDAQGNTDGCVFFIGPNGDDQWQGYDFPTGKSSTITQDAVLEFEVNSTKLMGVAA